jgi:hypothetical protein
VRLIKSASLIAQAWTMINVLEINVNTAPSIENAFDLVRAYTIQATKYMFNPKRMAFTQRIEVNGSTLNNPIKLNNNGSMGGKLGIRSKPRLASKFLAELI